MIIQIPFLTKLQGSQKGSHFEDNFSRARHPSVHETFPTPVILIDHHLLTYPFLYPCSFKQLRTHTFAYESPLHRRIINVYITLSDLKTFSLLFTYPVPHII